MVHLLHQKGSPRLGLQAEFLVSVPDSDPVRCRNSWPELFLVLAVSMVMVSTLTCGMCTLGGRHRQMLYGLYVPRLVLLARFRKRVVL